MTQFRVLLLPLVLSACATTHPLTSDAAGPDAGPEPCPQHFIDEGDACVAWRAIPSPPCEPTVLVRRGDEVGVRCASGMDYGLSETLTWEWRDEGEVVVLTPEPPAPEELIVSPRIAVTFGDGTRVATHGDPYALPEAWRTDARGIWQLTVPPPTAFVALGAALSDHEALFVGQAAYVFSVVWRRPAS